MALNTLPDLAGDNQVHNLATLFNLPSSAVVSMILIRELSGGISSSRVGGSNVAANQGVPLSTADTLIFPTGYYVLGDLYLYTATGDVLAIAIFR